MKNKANKHLDSYWQLIPISMPQAMCIAVFPINIRKYLNHKGEELKMWERKFVQYTKRAEAAAANSNWRMRLKIRYNAAQE